MSSRDPQPGAIHLTLRGAPLPGARPRALPAPPVGGTETRLDAFVEEQLQFQRLLRPHLPFLLRHWNLVLAGALALAVGFGLTLEALRPAWPGSLKAVLAVAALAVADRWVLLGAVRYLERRALVRLAEARTAGRPADVDDLVTLAATHALTRLPAATLRRYLEHVPCEPSPRRTSSNRPPPSGRRATHGPHARGGRSTGGS